MNANPPPSTDSPAELRADRSFRAFFRTQLPDPFPALELPPDAPGAVKPQPRRSFLPGSRIVLAVCVSLLLITLWSLLGQSLSDRVTPANPVGIKATHEKDGLGRPLTKP